MGLLDGFGSGSVLFPDQIPDHQRHDKDTAEDNGSPAADNASGNVTVWDSETDTEKIYPNLDDATQDSRWTGTDDSNNKRRTNIRPYVKDWIAIQSRRKRKERMNGGILRYPLEGLTSSTDYLQIDIKRYQPIGTRFTNDPNSGARTVVGNRVTNTAGSVRPANLSRRALVNDGTILLPIPSDIGSANSVNYGPSKLNPLQAAGGQAAMGLMEGGFENLQENAKKSWNTFKGRVESGAGSMEAGQDVFLTQLAAAGLSVLGGNVTANDLLSRAKGEIFNPNMELLFNGPTLRKFRFKFKMTPRSHKESEQLLLILRAFKRNMAPKVFGSSNSGNWFLKTPNVFELRYRTGSRDHAFLNKFKQCFLTDCEVSYTPDGVYATYDDTTPVAMNLDLQFQELVPIYDYDYDNGPGVSAIGY